MEEEKQEMDLMVMDMFAINRLPAEQRALWKRRYAVWRDTQRKQDKKEHNKIKDQIYRHDNPEKVKAIREEWCKANPDKVRKYAIRTRLKKRLREKYKDL